MQPAILYKEKLIIFTLISNDMRKPNTNTKKYRTKEHSNLNTASLNQHSSLRHSSQLKLYRDRKQTEVKALTVSCRSVLILCIL